MRDGSSVTSRPQGKYFQPAESPQPFGCGGGGRANYGYQRHCQANAGRSRPGDQLPSKTTLVRSTLHGCRAQAIERHSGCGPRADISHRPAGVEPPRTRTSDGIACVSHITPFE
jgi:hypothetical protein